MIHKIHQKKLLLAVISLLIAFLSVFVLSGVATSPQFHAGTLTALEEKQTTVLELTAASTAASAAITLLPGDTATPIAEKLADLSSGFLVVLCAIYLEKYLLTITGYAAFDFLIPAACLIYLISLFWNQEHCKCLARKLLTFGIAIVLVIPVSVKLSDLIEDTYQTSMEATIEAAKETAAAVEDHAETQEEADEGFWSGLFSQITDGISNAVTDISDQVGDLVNRFLEALAVMLVTACVIPILVLLFFTWLIKATFAVDLIGGFGSIPLRKKKIFSTEGRKSKDMD